MSESTDSPGLKEGKFQVYTGAGKGKSTASLGLTLRALGCGLRVYYLRLMKPRWKTGELTLLPGLHPNLTFRNVEQDWILSRSKEIPEHVEAMRKALAAEMDAVEEIMLRKEHDLIVLDEINYVLSRDLVPLERALRLVEKRPARVELVFTGRDAPEALIEKADLVTEMTMRKHYFDAGTPARRGIEF